MSETTEGPPQEGDHERYLALFKILAELLHIQIALIPVEERRFESENGLLNVGAIAYVWGFADCALQAAKLPLDSEDVQLLMTNLYEVFAPGKGERYLRWIAKNFARDDVMPFVLDGGNQYREWVNSKGKLIAWHWGHHFRTTVWAKDEPDRENDSEHVLGEEIERILATNSGTKTLLAASGYLTNEFVRGRFNSERALEVYTIAIERAVMAEVPGSEGVNLVLLSRRVGLTLKKAGDYLSRFKESCGAIDQRATRKGLSAKIFGK